MKKKVSSQTIYIIYYYLEYTSIYLKSREKSTLYCDDTFLGKNEKEIKPKKKAIDYGL